MPEVSIDSLEEIAKLAFTTAVIDKAMPATLPDSASVVVTDDQGRELHPEVTNGSARCSLKIGDSLYVGTVWRGSPDEPRSRASVNWVQTPAGKFWLGIGETLENPAEDYITARNKRIG